MTPEQRALETLILLQNAIDYWHEVDLKGGAGVSERFTEDGIFHAGPGHPLVGPGQTKPTFRRSPEWKG